MNADNELAKYKQTIKYLTITIGILLIFIIIQIHFNRVYVETRTPVQNWWSKLVYNRQLKFIKNGFSAFNAYNIISSDKSSLGKAIDGALLLVGEYVPPLAGPINTYLAYTYNSNLFQDIIGFWENIGV